MATKPKVFKTGFVQKNIEEGLPSFWKFKTKNYLNILPIEKYLY